MSRIGGPNEIATMSIGVVVDQSSLQASLAQTRATVEEFNKSVVVRPGGGVGPGGGVVGPGINPTGAMYEAKPGTVVPGGPGGGIVGPGVMPILPSVGPQLDATKEKFKETGREAAGMFEGINKNLRDQAAPWRRFNATLRQTQQAVFGLVGTVGAFVAAITGAAAAGRALSTFLLNTEADLKKLKQSIDDATRSVEDFDRAKNKASAQRLAAAGLSEDAIAQVQDRARRAAAREEQARIVVAEGDASEFRQLGRGLGGLGLIGAIARIQDARERNALAEASAERAATANQVSGLLRRGEDVTQRAVQQLSTTDRARLVREGMREKRDYGAKMEDANRHDRYTATTSGRR